MSSYLIPRHVHVCVTSDYAVFLDLRQNKYLALNGANAAALSGLVPGWPAQSRHGEVASTDQAAISVASLLSKRGLLTLDSVSGKPASLVDLIPSEEGILEDDELQSPTIRVHHVRNFIAASASAALSLRWSSIESIVERVGRRKQRGDQLARHRHFDADRRLVRIYMALRPLAFTAKDECLFDSLALVSFLSRYQSYPQWVIGVQTCPFRAHSWVQQHDVVYNDTPEYVRSFTPIMAI